jgi:tetratricopeptide (TPR) repeat protein
MGNERIEIDIVLNDGSVAKAFASIPKEAEKASKQVNQSIKTTEQSLDDYRRSIKQSTDFFNNTFRENQKSVDALNRKIREADLQSAFAPKSFNPNSSIISLIAQKNQEDVGRLGRAIRQADLESAFAGLPVEASRSQKAIGSLVDGFKAADRGFISFQNTIKSGFSNLFTLKNALIAAASAAGAFIVFRKVTGFIGSAVDEAIAGEEAINNLSNALRSAGDETEKNVKAFQDFAKETQKNTKLSDDQVLSLSALARNYAKSSEQSIELTRAAIQLSAATGKDTTTTLEFLGGTLQGVSGRLGKTIDGFEGLSESALKSGAAIDLVNKRFGGTAEAQLNTYAGSIAKAKNSFSDFLEEIGNQIINNPTVISAFKELGTFFTNVTEGLKVNLGGTKSVIDSIVLAGVDGFVLLAKAIANVGNNIDSIKLALASVITTLLKGNQLILDFDLAIAKLDKSLSFGSDSSKKYLEESKRLNDENKRSIAEWESLGVTIAESQIKSKGAFDVIINEAEKFRSAVKLASEQKGLLDKSTSAGAGSGTGVEAILPKPDKSVLDYEKSLFEIKRQALLARTELVALGKTDVFGAYTQEIANIPSAMQIASATTLFEVENMKRGIDGLKDTFVNNGNQIKQALETGLSNAISSSISTIVSSIVAGENAFKAFANNLLGVIGDLAQQIGGFIIAAGIAKLQLFSGNPISTIAAGAALVAIGAALSAINKKGQKGGFSGAAPGSSVTPPLTPAQPISGGFSDQVGDRRAQVNLTVQGNVYDPQGTGLAIANLLKGAGFDGAVVT